MTVSFECILSVLSDALVADGWIGNDFGVAPTANSSPALLLKRVFIWPLSLSALFCLLRLRLL